jgi:hypothetical protein
MERLSVSAVLAEREVLSPKPLQLVFQRLSITLHHMD